ncbi:peptidase inhibitor family I36 protein [Streptomyces sp. NPDC093509]|uniref:peptidase inhibitor family I36 protein n=1 Tax=Streptomyces sp. NPDC093509 TaxID=3154982 RepID=UPI00344B7F89
MKAAMVAALVIGAGIIAAPSASAVPLGAPAAKAGCGSGWVCMWKSVNYTGATATFNPSTFGMTADLSEAKYLWTDGSSLNDSISSLVNFSNTWNVRFYRDWYWSAAQLGTVPGDGYSTLSGTGVNHSISSIDWTACNGTCGPGHNH